jgi:ferritin-like metal-binding protein YciE
MTNHETLHDLYLDQLRDLYSAERQILDALPELQKAAHSDELSNAFRTHFQETEGQVERLERIFDVLNEKPGGEKCEAIEGILKEGKKELKHWREAEPDLLDAALIASGQRVEHYEMAAYRTARTLAERLNRDTDAQLLQETLDEEKHADRLLTGIADSIMPASRSASGLGRTSASAPTTGVSAR